MISATTYKKRTFTPRKRRINDNLEQQAQALFKSWFVDFEPFKDGEFVDSELGMIPKGWCIKKLEEYVTIKRGSSPRPIQEYISSNGFYWLKISDATANNNPFIFEIKEHIKKKGLSKTIFLKQGNLVLSNSATPCIPKLLELDTCIHDGWLYFTNSKLSNEFLYLLFKNDRCKILSQGNGSVFFNLKTDILKSHLICLPCELKEINHFNSLIKQIFLTIKELSSEIINLIKLRDSLLPRLMSGELKINDLNC